MKYGSENSMTLYLNFYQLEDQGLDQTVKVHIKPDEGVAPTVLKDTPDVNKYEFAIGKLIYAFQFLTQASRALTKDYKIPLSYCEWLGV